MIIERRLQWSFMAEQPLKDKEMIRRAEENKNFQSNPIQSIDATTIGRTNILLLWPSILSQYDQRHIRVLMFMPWRHDDTSC